MRVLRAVRDDVPDEAEDAEHEQSGRRDFWRFEQSGDALDGGIRADHDQARASLRSASSVSAAEGRFEQSVVFRHA